MTVGIVGLGIIGGSFAKAIKENTRHTVLGAARTEATVLAALAAGAIDGALTRANIGKCDMLLVAVPPRACVDWIRASAPLIKKGGIVVDACGVKRTIVSEFQPLAAEYGFTYIGGHPMAGKEVSGFVSATPTLYNGASMILTPAADATPQLLEEVSAFFLSLGFGRITYSTPEEHDRTIAYTSQLAHVASSSYIKSPTSQGQAGFSAGSFHDMTRVARLDEALWTELFSANSDYLVEELREYIGHLNDFLTALESEDWESVRALLKQGREMKESSVK